MFYIKISSIMNILHNPEQRRFTLTQNGETAHVAYLI